MLSEWATIVGLHIEIKRFIRRDQDDSRKSWITTEALPEYFRQWRDSELQLFEELDHSSYKTHIDTCLAGLRSLLEPVLKWLYKLATSTSSGKRIQCTYPSVEDSQPQVISPQLATAVFALRYSICNSAKVIWRLPSGIGLDPGGMVPGMQGPRQSLLLSRLLTNGWCPYDVKFVGDTVTLDACYYLSSYYPSRTLRDHEGCDENHCEADIVRKSDGYTC